MNSASDGVCIDTNVLIYARDRREADKRGRARAWLAAISDAGQARTNIQVLNELTRWILRNESGRPLAEVRSEIDVIAAWGDRVLDPDDVDIAWLVRRTLGYQWFDRLMIAAAQSSGCRYFLTEDMAHGATFEGLTLIDPFRAEPAEIIRRN